jgi:hypothetical protein
VTPIKIIIRDESPECGCGYQSGLYSGIVKNILRNIPDPGNIQDLSTDIESHGAVDLAFPAILAG